MVANRKPLLLVEAIQELGNERNRQSQHRRQRAPERQPCELGENRHAQGERPRHADEAYCLLGKVPESTLVGFNQYVIESTIAKKPMIPERRVAPVVVIGLLVNTGTKGSSENDPPTRHEYARNLANDRD